SFTLQFDGQTTTALAYNATAAQVITALNGLSTIGGSANGKVDVTKSTNSSNTVYRVTFGGALLQNNLHALSATGTGGAPGTAALGLDGYAKTQAEGTFPFDPHVLRGSHPVLARAAVWDENSQRKIVASWTATTFASISYSFALPTVTPPAITLQLKNQTG